MNPEHLQFAFYGTSEFAIIVLEELKKRGLEPSLIISQPNKPKGRKLVLTPPPVKIWADENKINILQPDTLDDNFIKKIQYTIYDIFIVASYGKIIPHEVLDLPKHGTLNIHPSLLPLYRGPSPIQTQIVDGVEKSGVTIMLLDEKMDHGPIVAQQELGFKISNLEFRKVHDALAHLGGTLLTEVLPKWVSGEIKPAEQEHSKATYSKLIKKEDGLIHLEDDPGLNFRKYLAYKEWPGTYFFTEKNIRIKVTDAEFKNGEFVIKKVIPEGQKEVAYKAFATS